MFPHDPRQWFNSAIILIYSYFQHISAFALALPVFQAPKIFLHVPPHLLIFTPLWTLASVTFRGRSSVISSDYIRHYVIENNQWWTFNHLYQLMPKPPLYQTACQSRLVQLSGCMPLQAVSWWLQTWHPLLALSIAASVPAPASTHQQVEEKELQETGRSLSTTTTKCKISHLHAQKDTKGALCRELHAGEGVLCHRRYRMEHSACLAHGWNTWDKRAFWVQSCWPCGLVAACLTRLEMNGNRAKQDLWHSCSYYSWGGSCSSDWLVLLRQGPLMEGRDIKLK